MDGTKRARDTDLRHVKAELTDVAPLVIRQRREKAAPDAVETSSPLHIRQLLLQFAQAVMENCFDGALLCSHSDSYRM